ncbi:hypothetical protein V5O48_008365 [Marasmius crinis-equi]|uniref:Uncharacterized protein n=1 Tax=Marasmius crinis-equi TaxID=585013 RepID=A0ABR3FE41_9AGAR
MIIQRQPYSGQYRALVLAFDVGTTFSGISYSILDPGVVPEIQPVTRFPAQEHMGGDAKIPSIIYYDREGRVKAVGAEALQEHVKEEADRNGWFLSKWFKLHLKPKSSVGGTGSQATKRIPSLPPSKSAEEVLADYLAYLFECAKEYIVQTIPDRSFWSFVQPHIEFVLSHPNGWEGAQQYSMRCAAIKAGLIPDTPEGRDRLTFVTEGEACLHFCIHNNLSVSECESVLIVDAGGGTIDLSTYTVHAAGTGSVPGIKRLEEIAAPQCLFSGSIFVTNNARRHVNEKLSGTEFYDSIDRIVEEFDKTAKLRFKSANQPTYIRFGSINDNDPYLHIRNGQMVLPGTIVEQFFEPSLVSLVESIEKLIVDVVNQPIKSIFLVGGFSGSEWLFSKLEQYARSFGIGLCRPRTNANKATADGAVSFYLDRLVSARMARWSYGIQCSVTFNANNVEHLIRADLATVAPSGERLISKRFSCILSKVSGLLIESSYWYTVFIEAGAQNTRVSETQEFRAPFTKESYTRFGLHALPIKILSYRGTNVNPRWMDVEAGNYPVLCTVEADTQQIASALPAMMSSEGTQYFELKFDVVLLFGLTELKAQLSWRENGIEKRCPAEIIYDPE